MNIQNIPARGKHGKLIRGLFIPAEGHLLVIGDLSAIELRLVADFSQESSLLRAFELGLDVHQLKADEVGITRDGAKTFAYGSVYGQSLKRAAVTLGWSISETKGPYNRFHASIPRVSEWKQEVVEECRHKGYVELPSGRRRYLPDINSYDRERRGYAERQAVNTWPQGTAADLMKIAQVLLYREGIVPSAQVHDEFYLEAPEDECEGICRAIEKAVGAAAEVLGIRVPVVVEPKIVRSWGEKG